MADLLPIFVLMLAVLAVLLRADFVLTVVYLFVGAFLLGRWWSERSVKQVSVQRALQPRMFLGERVTVELEINNPGFLPVVWLEFHESLPVELTLRERLSQVISLNSWEKRSIRYELEGRKRGLYNVGPLLMYSGDLLGFSTEIRRQEPAQQILVYPRIIPLTQVRLPSGAPLGSLRHFWPIYEDPSRTRGKREYVTGDSLRRVDWKASAAMGRLQVKQFEPSIAVETMIFLNMNSDEYLQRTWIDSTELAIVVAASLASWIVQKKQAVGLATNGAAVVVEDEEQTGLVQQMQQVISPGRGRGHLMRLLEVLARVQATKQTPFLQLLRQESAPLSWGSTLMVITGEVNDDLFDQLFGLRRAGLHTLLIPCGQTLSLDEPRRKAEKFGISMVPIVREKDLDIWRK